MYYLLNNIHICISCTIKEHINIRNIVYIRLHKITIDFRANKYRIILSIDLAWSGQHLKPMKRIRDTKSKNPDSLQFDCPKYVTYFHALWLMQIAWAGIPIIKFALSYFGLPRMPYNHTYRTCFNQSEMHQRLKQGRVGGKINAIIWPNTWPRHLSKLR